MKNNVLNIFLIINTLVAGFVTATVLPVTAAEMSYAEAVNIAGRQRMLTQRITKSYCQIGLNVFPLDSRQQLEEALKLFTTQLADLKQFASTPEVVNALDDVESLWKDFSELATTTPTLDNARKLAELDEKLLQSSEHVVALIEEQSGIPSSRLVNISGRQRMLSQRLAKFYLLLAWDPTSSSAANEMDRAKNEFYGALLTLAEVPENTIAINEKLEEAKQQWGWLSSSMAFSQNTYFPEIVSDASEKMLGIMERVTEMYEQQVNRIH